MKRLKMTEMIDTILIKLDKILELLTKGAEK